jgi:hypothetical protein
MGVLIMRYVIVFNGAVINSVEWDGVSSWIPEYGDAILAPEGVGIGWTYDGETFFPPSTETEEN